jgi:type IV fimbrial biogenesis protein FimT
LLDDPTRGLQLKSQRGWGLIEVLLVVTLVGTGMALGLPTVADVLERSRLVSAAADLEHAARVARSEALKRNTTVVLTAGPGFWQVSADSTGDTEVLHAGGLDARVALDSGSIAFSGSGLTHPVGAQLSLDLALGVDPENCASTQRCRRLQVDAGGLARICDPLKGSGQWGACS